ncbi:hypothetical protein JD844_006108 [Phrynosoma platyrhinos]|uniref:Uncharacterized protein n=1 Tax=Phrynosoma platyrhinos TaxID=52577 RepID=A0ABQ7TPC9_PHRPL|nr:hypothetical protein JD844_006108 [Phrynosoma platyrhinos]
MTYYPTLDITSKGPGFTGRETLFKNCTLRITHLNLNDSKAYTITVDGPGVFEIAKVNLMVSVKETPTETRGLSAMALGGIIVGCMLAFVVAILGAILFARE